MALFEKLFGKRDCEICGGDMGLLGNYKLADGDLCKKCAEGLSPLMRLTDEHTVAQIKEHLAYREENAALLEQFNPTEVFGQGAKLFFDLEMNRFAFARTGDWKEEAADLIPFDQVTAVETDIEEDELAFDEEDENGEDTGNVDFVKALYYHVKIQLSSPWFDEIELELTDGETPADTEIEKCEMFKAQQDRIAELLGAAE